MEVYQSTAAQGADRVENRIRQLRDGRLTPGAGLTFGLHRPNQAQRTDWDSAQLTEDCRVGRKPDGDPYRFLIKTYGCQMNEHDTEIMAGLFREMGYDVAADVEQADVILFNTCAVRENAEDKVFGEIGRLRPLKTAYPGLLLGLCGCMAQEHGVLQRIQAKIPWVDFVFGTHNIHRLPKLVRDARHSRETVMEVWDQAAQTVENLPRARKDHVRAWVNIQYGCNKHCTYCIVPATRGQERSRQPADILEEVNALAATGYREVTLLGQNVNDYGVDLGSVTFADLLRLVNQVQGIDRIRFTTSNPWNFTDDLMDAIAASEKVADHIHLPVQSGNSEVLHRMNRTYSREYYLQLVGKIRSKLPNVSLTTDVIVGFPGETELQFLDTLSLLEQVRFANAYTFIYSPRENTPAATFVDTAGDEEKRDRLRRLNDVQARISREENETLRGQSVEVLVEGQSKTNASVMTGRTSTNRLVLFPGHVALTGQRVHVEIVEPLTWTLKGRMKSWSEKQCL